MDRADLPGCADQMSKLTCVALSLLTASFMTYLAARHTVLPQPRQGFGLLGREAAGNSTTTPPCASLGARAVIDPVQSPGPRLGWVTMAIIA